MSGKLTPKLDEEETKILNLTVLQRIDSFIEEILFTASHVTFYEFNIELNEWSRKDVEGTLFVVKRNTQPRFQFIVMNRRNTDNLVESLLGDFEYEVQLPYLLYRNAAQEVTGIWFYHSNECEEVGNLFSRILGAYSKVSPKTKVSSTKSEFEELETIQTVSMIEGALKPSSLTVSTVSDVPDESIITNLFRGARITENASNAAIQEQGQQYSAMVPLSSLAPTAISSHMPTLHMPSAPLPTAISYGTSNNRATLVKPSLFSAPPLSSASQMSSIYSIVPTVTPLPPLSLQQTHGAPFLQPFPPPNQSRSLTPPFVSGPVITRDRVRDALQRLSQTNQFIDMFYQQLLNPTS